MYEGNAQAGSSWPDGLGNGSDEFIGRRRARVGVRNGRDREYNGVAGVQVRGALCPPFALRSQRYLVEPDGEWGGECGGDGVDGGGDFRGYVTRGILNVRDDSKEGVGRWGGGTGTDGVGGPFECMRSYRKDCGRMDKVWATGWRCGRGTRGWRGGRSMADERVDVGMDRNRLVGEGDMSEGLFLAKTGGD